MAYTSPFAAIDIPEVDLFTHIFGDLTEEEGSLPALTELTTEMTVSYRGLREMAESDAGALAERIGAMIDSVERPSAAACRAHARAHDWDVIAGRVAEVYRAVLAR